MTPNEKDKPKYATIEILRGKRTGNFLICADGTLVCGTKDGFGYTAVRSWSEPRERWATTLECLSEINDDELYAKGAQ